MAKYSFSSVKIAGDKRILNARKDTPDSRDRIYEPPRAFERKINKPLLCRDTRRN